MHCHRFARVLLVSAMLAIILAWSPPTSGAAQAASDERAVAIVDQMMTALGGRENWDRTRFIQFTFVRGDTRLKLTWDKWTGRYRLDATTPEGRPYVVLMNVETREGTAYVDGTPVADAERDEYLQGALRIWAGETYWLLMPYKLQDPGVIVRYDGEETLDGTVYDRLHVTFESVGLTPGDQFWAYINRTTHLMDRWRFALQVGAKGEFWWRGWQRYGSLLLAPTREALDGTVAIRMEDITVTDTMPDEIFSRP